MSNFSHHVRSRWNALVRGFPLALGLSLILAGCGGGGGGDDDSGVGITNTAPTASNFACSANVGNTAKSCNWRTGSSATDVNGDAMTATFYYPTHPFTFTTFGTPYGTFTIAADTITYTPSIPSSVTTDVATLRITDSRGAYRDVTVTASGIDGAGPVLSPTGTTKGSGSYTTTLVSDEGIQPGFSVETKYGTSASSYGALPGGISINLAAVGLVSGSSNPRTLTYTVTGASSGYYQALFTVSDSLNNTSTHTLYFSLP
jgi:hypothetical protein